MSDCFDLTIIDQLRADLSRVTAERDEEKESASYWERRAETERGQRQKEIGMQEYRGNTVSYIYDKLANYCGKFSEKNAESAALRARVADLQQQLDNLTASVNDKEK